MAPKKIFANFFYLFIAILCIKMSRVNKALTWLNLLVVVLFQARAPAASKNDMVRRDLKFENNIFAL